MKWRLFAEDNLPEHYQSVLVSDGKSVWIEWKSDEFGWHADDGVEGRKPIYFMYVEDIPLPGADFTSPTRYFDSTALINPHLAELLKKHYESMIEEHSNAEKE
jgi:hypothetical protein